MLLSPPLAPPAPFAITIADEPVGIIGASSRIIPPEPPPPLPPSGWLISPAAPDALTTPTEPIVIDAPAARYRAPPPRPPAPPVSVSPVCPAQPPRSTVGTPCT